MIVAAVQQGKWVKVYDERKRQILIKAGELYGYTSTTVSVRDGKWVKTFDERGRQIAINAVG